MLNLFSIKKKEYNVDTIKSHSTLNFFFPNTKLWSNPIFEGSYQNLSTNAVSKKIGAEQLVHQKPVNQLPKRKIADYDDSMMGFNHLMTRV